MPGYVIHISVANEYVKKHPDHISDYNEFINGVIFPDSVSDKSLTHYGEKSSKSNLLKFLEEKDLDTDFNKGYFIHLLTDYLFYNRYLTKIGKAIYHDYDLLNDDLVEKYHVILPESVKKVIIPTKEGKTTFIDLPFTEKFIEDVSNLDMFATKEDILKNPNEWTKIRELIRF